MLYCYGQLRSGPARALGSLSCRTAEGKSRTEIRRCLKRYIAREIYPPPARYRPASAATRKAMARQFGPSYADAANRGSVPLAAEWLDGGLRFAMAIAMHLCQAAPAGA